MQAGERFLNTEGSTASARIALAVDPNWIGKSITGESGAVHDLRQALVEAQRDVLRLLQVPNATFHTLKLRWETEDKDGTGWTWNPQVNITEDTELLICVGECRYAH